MENKMTGAMIDKKKGLRLNEQVLHCTSHSSGVRTFLSLVVAENLISSSK